MAFEPANDKLDGWRAIADYLGKSVRTAQRWEAEYGLPVHRIEAADDNQAPNVFALAREVDEWWGATFRNGTSVAGEEPAINGGPGGRRISPWLRHGAVVVGIAALVLLAMGVLARLSAPGQPHSVRPVEVNELGVFDEDDNLLWSKVFPIVLFNLPLTDTIMARAEDIDHDGSKEVLFPANSVGPEPGATDWLYCYSATGEQLWYFQPGKELALHGRRFANSFQVRDFAIGSRGGGETFVAVSAVHRPHAPTQLAVLDARGVQIGEYWHYGYVLALATDDIDGDGVDEILLGGVNNAIADPEAARSDLARQQAFIAVIEHDIQQAISPGPIEVPADLRRNQELVYIALPFPSAFNAAYLGSRVIGIEPTEQGFAVHLESNAREIRGVTYDFDRRFELLGVRLSAGFRESHDNMLRDGFVTLGIDEERERLRGIERLVWRLPEIIASH